MTRSRLSVTLCTYNGQRYLRQQLDSIAAQTRPPDELVAFDDASTDGTPETLRGFAASTVFPVRIVSNRARVGSTANFQNAIAAAAGDIIVLCDQDDVWRPDKLAHVEAAFAARPEARCVFSDAEVVDEHLRPLGYRLWRSVGFDRGKQRRMASGAALDVLLQQNVVTGATMALRSELRELVLPIPTGWVHDGWIALLAAAVGDCLPLSEPLVLYRQHAEQQIGGLRRTLLQQIAAARAMRGGFFDELAHGYQAARDRLAAARTPPCPQDALRQLDAKIAHCRRRVQIRDHRWRHLSLVLEELRSGGYRRYSMGWKSVASDLFL